MSGNISQLNLPDGHGGWILALRWMEVQPATTLEANTATWQFGMSRKTYVCRFQAPVVLVDAGNLNQRLQEIRQGGLRCERCKVKTVSARGSVWSLQQPVETVLRNFVNLRRAYLILAEDAVVEALTIQDEPVEVEIKSYYLAPDETRDLVPLCLHREHIEEAAEIVEHKAVRRGPLGCSTQLSLPAPGFWPVTKIYVRNTLPELAVAIQTAIGQCRENISRFGRPRLVEVEGMGISTFLRDYWVNVCHCTPEQGRAGSLSTTKNAGQGWRESGSMSNIKNSTVPLPAQESGFGFGGNFLTCLIGETPFLIYGGCSHQVGQYSDDSFMIRNLLGELRESITTVKLDTGWLKVGHVDEILTFPRPGIALLASPQAFFDVSQKRGLHEHLVNVDLNLKFIELKLRTVAETLARIGCEVRPIPVWFKPLDSDPAHITSVRGSAVNCIYVGEFSIHSQSGFAGKGPMMAQEGFPPSSAIDEHVAGIMGDLGYRALFVPMEAANDEGGAGGNVHCATYTVHYPT